MDVHENLGDVTEDDIKSAHQRDLDVQDRHGVSFLTYWFNSPDGQAFCLVDAPTKDAAVAVHKESHGLVPHNMIEVEKPTVSRFMGDWEKNVPDIARHEDAEIDTGLRAIMFTDLVGSTAVSSRDGDATAMELLRRHGLPMGNLRSSGLGRTILWEPFWMGDKVLLSALSNGGL